jgi:hypothetical protein
MPFHIPSKETLGQCFGHQALCKFMMMMMMMMMMMIMMMMVMMMTAITITKHNQERS